MSRNPRSRNLPTTVRALALLLGLPALGCATAAPVVTAEQEELQKSRRQVEELREQVSSLTARLEGMELKVTTLNDQLIASKTSVEALKRRNQPGDAQEVKARPWEGVGGVPATEKAATDPQAAFASDGAVQAYRKAVMFFDSKRYADAMLAFTAFLEQHADHAWAGAAQYFVGRSYQLQNECKLALQEFQRVLTAYDRSTHVADTLRDMAACETELHLDKDAARHRQMLASLFPNSPAAREIVASATTRKTESRPQASARTESPDEEHSIPPTAPAEGTGKP